MSDFRYLDFDFPDLGSFECNIHGCPILVHLTLVIQINYFIGTNFRGDKQANNRFRGQRNF